MTLEFPAGTRWLQMKGRALALTPDDRAYLVRNGRAVELVPHDPTASDETPGPLGMAPNQSTGD